MKPVRSIALLTCRSPFLDDSKIYCPLAALYLKAYLNTHVPQVQVVLGDDEYDVDRLDGLEPFDTVGISIMTPQRHQALRLATCIKQRWPEKTIIAGGPHVKHYLGELLAEPVYDYLVPLDGERALSTIVTGRATSRVVHDVLTKDEVLGLPRPDRTSANAIETLRRYTYALGDRSATTLMTARGCPEQCTFCEDAMTQVRWSSVANIAAELDDIVALGYRGVYIFDDLFAMSETKIRPICECLAARDLRYRCNAQARYFTRRGEGLARLLSSTGCHEIAFGAESGSQKILDNVRKRCTVEQNYQTVAFAKKHGIVVKAFVLLGLPGEDWETLAHTEAFIRDSGIDDFQCAVYMPFRGTQIRDAIDKGAVIDLRPTPRGHDGEVTGAYATKGGNSAYEVRTQALSAGDLHAFRDYLVGKYRPASHRTKWAPQDKFFELAHVTTAE
jgi:anaerobic magnesium-protoporphyrin IX monomethyl ester cyclase